MRRFAASGCCLRRGQPCKNRSPKSAWRKSMSCPAIRSGHQAHSERYTRELTDALEAAALEALKDRRPAKLWWGQGTAGFAANRRTKGGPVDHDLPLLVVKDSQEKIRAILANYACHCTTLGGDTNWICGDWAGYAQEYLEAEHPGAMALIS